MDTNIDNLITDKLLRMQLVEKRKAKRLTQEELSKLSGLSKSCISNIESGDNNSPTLRSLIRYMNALGLEIYISEKVNE